jgi:hypothetical protein
MSITVEAVYENGVLKPARPSPFREHAVPGTLAPQAVSQNRKIDNLLPATLLWTAHRFFVYSKWEFLERLQNSLHHQTVVR